MHLLVGLGNPGAPYAKNRHNIGFMAAEAIARAHGFGPFRARFQARVAEGMVGGDKALVVLPQTYMNESGQAVGEAARFYKLGADSVIALHDELDLAPARCRVKTGGGVAGHNGLRSLSQHLGGDYKRVRLGIGRPDDKARVHAYVLSDFAKSEWGWVDVIVAAVGAHAGLLIHGADASFQNKVRLALVSAGFAHPTDSV